MLDTTLAVWQRTSSHLGYLKQGKSSVVKDNFDPRLLDDGIRKTVMLLCDAGFKTFTSCLGGRGHAFQYETVGLELDGQYEDFEKRLVGFLHAQRRSPKTSPIDSAYVALKAPWLRNDVTPSAFRHESTAR
jgi:hypothetical protein